MPRKKQTSLTQIETKLTEESSVLPTVGNQVLPERSYKKIKIFLSISVLLILALGGLFGWSYRRQKNLEKIVSKTEVTQDKFLKEEALKLVATVSKIILLPEEEMPTIATVSELEPLKGQLFFEKAQVGDKVLVYTQKGRAFLFRPSENKIIEVASFASATPNQNGEKRVLGAQEASYLDFKVEIRNASGRNGEATKLKDKIASYGWLSVETVSNAKTSLEKSIIVDLSGGKKTEFVARLGKELQMPVLSSIPSDQEGSRADALIFLGKE